MTSDTQLTSALRRHHQSVTNARRVVFNALQGQEPLSMTDLVRRASGIDRATVYRTVTLFERLGIIQRLQTGWKYTLELGSEFHDHHHHATCLGCNISIVLPEDQSFELSLTIMAQGQGFTIKRHQIELQGYCETCSRQTSPL
jgi:Fe2+ or Zn2+ uptake regulation protein